MYYLVKTSTTYSGGSQTALYQILHNLSKATNLYNSLSTGKIDIFQVDVSIIVGIAIVTMESTSGFLKIKVAL
jgi:hypothetical protein